MRLIALMIFLFWSWPLLAEQGGELFVAAAAGQVERVDALLAQGADVNAKNAIGRTPLMGAASAGNVRIIRKLLAFGADPNAADNRGITALMEAATNGFEPAAKALIDAGADVNAKNAAGLSVLERTKKGGQGRIVALLEAAGAGAGASSSPVEVEKSQKSPESGEHGADTEGKVHSEAAD